MGMAFWLECAKLPLPIPVCRGAKIVVLSCSNKEEIILRINWPIHVLPHLFMSHLLRLVH